MFKSFKVNTAIIICAAFILKLLVVHAGLISLNGRTSTSAKTQFSFKITTVEASAASSDAEYSAEICEDSDEETQLKINSFLPTQLLYSFFGTYSSSALQKTLPLAQNFSFIETDRCLALQVFRI